MSDKTVKITSNDSDFLEKIYNNFQQERLDISMEKVPVKDAMGFDVVLNIDLTDIALIVGMIRYCIIDKKCAMFLKKPDKDDEIIDAKLFDNPQDVIELVKDKDAELYIEHQER